MTAEFIFVAPTSDSNPVIRSEKESVHQLASSMLPKFERDLSPVATEWSRKLAALTAFLRRRYIENHGAYAIVRKHPPDPDGDGVNTEITTLYHVRREPQIDGTESLHWAYLGDVHNSVRTRCDTCGRTFDEDVEICPHCGSDDIDHPDSAE